MSQAINVLYCRLLHHRLETNAAGSFQNNVTMTQEVAKVTDDTVTVKMTTSMPAMPTPMVRNHDFPRYGKPGPDGKPPEPKGKKLPDQTESDMMGTMAIVMELVEFKK